MKDEFAGKTILVTGAAQGIGRAIAGAFAAAGASIVLTDVADEAGLALAGELCAQGTEARFIRQDVRDEAGWIEVMAAVERTFDGLDIVVNNAGVEIAGLIENFDLTEWRRLMDINLFGVMLGTKHALPRLRRGGAIVNMASGAARRPGLGMAAYGASKAGVVHFSQSAALEAAARGLGLRVNCVLPGMIDTAMAAQLGDHYAQLGLVPDAGAMRAGMLQRIPLGRYGAPEEVAALVLFLCSDAASYITGACIPIDGALTLV